MRIGYIIDVQNVQITHYQKDNKMSKLRSIDTGKKKIKSTPVQVFEKTKELGYDDDDKIIVAFSTCEGEKGHGTQSLPFAELVELNELIQSFKGNVPNYNKPENETACQAFKRTLMVKDGIVSFKLSGSKGSKSTLAGTQAEFDAFADAFGKTTIAFVKAVKALEE